MKKVKLGELLIYEQPTKYLVNSDFYNNNYKTPVLTAGKSFLLGYSNEKENIFDDIPVIIFDDFTTASQYVDFPFKVKSSAMKILHCNYEKTDIRYIFHQLQRINIDTRRHKRYWISEFANLEIPLPPLPQQKAIAAQLDKAQELIQYNEQLIEKYDELQQSLFLDMFGDPVINEKGWEKATITNLVTKSQHSIKRGPFGGALKKEIFVDDGYLVYEQYHALNKDFSMMRYFITDEKFEELKAFEVKPGDIIISCSGVYLGKLAIIPKNARKGIINQALLKITLDNEIMRNDFFVFHFSNSNFKNKYFKANRGAGIPNFPPMTEFRKFPFILPPLDLQNDFAQKIESVEIQKEQAKEALAKSKDIFQGLLQEHFF